MDQNWTVALTAGVAAGGRGVPEWVGRAPHDWAHPRRIPPLSPLSRHRVLALGSLCHSLSYLSNCMLQRIDR